MFAVVMGCARRGRSESGGDVANAHTIALVPSNPDGPMVARLRLVCVRMHGDRPLSEIIAQPPTDASIVTIRRQGGIEQKGKEQDGVRLWP